MNLDKLECKYYLIIGRFIGLRPWQYIGGGTMAFWKGRLVLLTKGTVVE